MTNLRHVVADLMDQQPTTVEGEVSDAPERVRAAVAALPWVEDVEVRLREEGHLFAGELFVTARSIEGLSRRVEEAREAATAVDWRVQDTTVANGFFVCVRPSPREQGLCRFFTDTPANPIPKRRWLALSAPLVFEQAASKYQKAIDLAPTGERTPDALLRLGLALRSLRREDRAREVWARLLKDFPDSDAAVRARAVLRQPARAVRSAEPR